tara:strand:- start:702 stop:1190 length:489 start_codon:yes stop_codon:yes gene_type:complete
MFKLAILTISDAGSKGERLDTSGDVISDYMSEKEFELIERSILPDEVPKISEKLIQWSDECNIDLILTTGGTGLGPRDVTPEATRAVIDFEVSGITEAMRIQTLSETNFAMLSRAVAGVRNGCLIINFPGSPTGVTQTIKIVADVIPHALEMIRGWRTHKNP